MTGVLVEMGGQRSMGGRLWQGYRDIFTGFTILMVVLLPLFLASMTMDSVELVSIAGFVITPALLWWILSRRHPATWPCFRQVCENGGRFLSRRQTCTCD